MNVHTQTYIAYLKLRGSNNAHTSTKKQTTSTTTVKLKEVCIYMYT